MNSQFRAPLKIGFDVAQTCGSRAGCGWYADALIWAMTAAATDHQFFLYHRFGGLQNTDAALGTRIERPGVSMPFSETSKKDSVKIWNAVATGTGELPGEPDIVQSNSFQAPPVGKAKLVVVIHDVSFWANPEFSTERNRIGCQAGVFEALKRADGIIFVSHSSHEEFERMLPSWLRNNRMPFAVIHEAGRLQPEADPATGSTGQFWLAVGSLEPRKNYENLLTALQIYWDKSSQRVPLHLAGGDGWMNEALLWKLAELGNRGMVSRLGYVPDENLVSTYQSARALIFPSWYEGFGLPVLEGMQCGCPVISSIRTSMAEIGGGAVIAIDPASPESIAAAMLRIEEEPGLRDQLICAGKAQAERFSWDKAARATLEFYDTVMNNSGV